MTEEIMKKANEIFNIPKSNKLNKKLSIMTKTLGIGIGVAAIYTSTYQWFVSSATLCLSTNVGEYLAGIVNKMNFIKNYKNVFEVLNDTKVKIGKDDVEFKFRNKSFKVATDNRFDTLLPNLIENSESIELVEDKAAVLDFIKIQPLNEELGYDERDINIKLSKEGELKFKDNVWKLSLEERKSICDSKFRETQSMLFKPLVEIIEFVNKELKEGDTREARRWDVNGIELSLSIENDKEVWQLEKETHICPLSKETTEYLTQFIPISASKPTELESFTL